MLAFDVDERRALDSAGLHFLVDKVDAELGALRDAVDLIWVLHSASFVFFMQCGFAMCAAHEHTRARDPSRANALAILRERTRSRFYASAR